MDFKSTEISTKGVKLTLKEKNQEIGRIFIYLIKNDLHEKPYALLENLFVNENFRKKGYGQKLMEAAIEFAKDNHCYKIICTSRYSREHVHKFYQKLGFIEYGKEFRLELE